MGRESPRVIRRGLCQSCCSSAGSYSALAEQGCSQSGQLDKDIWVFQAQPRFP